MYEAENDNDNDNDNKKSINKNARVIWTFTLGIPIDTTNEYDPEQKTDNFENAVFEMTKEMTKITDGLTYEYCYGMWLQKNHGSHELTHLSKDNSNSNTIEHNLSVQITIIVLPEIADDIYNMVKHIISKVNKKYELGVMNVQAMKTNGISHHFVLN